MTAVPETGVQHAVRYRMPGDNSTVLWLCDDLAGVIEVMDDLASEFNVTYMEPVIVPVPEWSIDPAGLPAAVRHLAEAYADDQIAEATVGTQLAAWFPGADRSSLAQAPWAAVVAIRAHREAEDGPLDEGQDREQLVAAAEERITAAVREICGGRS